MGSKMTDEQIEELIKEVDTQGDGYIYIDEMAQRLCPPKKWLDWLSYKIITESISSNSWNNFKLSFTN